MESDDLHCLLVFDYISFYKEVCVSKTVTTIQYDGETYFIQDVNKNGVFDPENDAVYKDTVQDGRFTKYRPMVPDEYDRESDKIGDVKVSCLAGAEIKKLRSLFEAVTAVKQNPLHTVEDCRELVAQMGIIEESLEEAHPQKDQFMKAVGSNLVHQVDAALSLGSVQALIPELQEKANALGLQVDWPSQRGAREMVVEGLTGSPGSRFLKQLDQVALPRIGHVVRSQKENRGGSELEIRMVLDSGGHCINCDAETRGTRNSELTLAVEKALRTATFATPPSSILSDNQVIVTFRVRIPQWETYDSRHGEGEWTQISTDGYAIVR
jgi:hypothetical protein